MKKIISIIFSVLFLLCFQSAIFAYDFTAEDVIPCDCCFVGKINIAGFFAQPITSAILGELTKDPKFQEINGFCINAFNFDIKKDINNFYLVAPDSMDTKSNNNFYFVLDGNFDLSKLSNSLKSFEDFQFLDTGKGVKAAKYLKNNSYILLLSNKCLVITFNLGWFFNNIMNKNTCTFETYQCFRTLSPNYLISGFGKITEEIQNNIRDISHYSSNLGSRYLFNLELSNNGILALSVSALYTSGNRENNSKARDFWNTFFLGIKESMRKDNTKWGNLLSDFTISFDDKIMYLNLQKSLEEIMKTANSK